MWIRHENTHNKYLTSTRDLLSGNQGSWEKEGGIIGCKVDKYEWIWEKRKGQDSKNRGRGEQSFSLVKGYLCDIVEVINGTKFDESICVRVPGERASKYLFLANTYMPPESKNTVNDIYGERPKQ